MAKLLSYYRLCPLIDIKNLLGISEDPEKGVVIVTLGKNIAIKYRLSDQKQLCSWRSKEKFSSPVYFNSKSGKYVAAFNQSFIRIWTDEDEALDKVKKYKFNHQIYSIFAHNGEVHVMFKCGSLYPLSDILDSRSDFAPSRIFEHPDIFDFKYFSLEEDLYIGILIKDSRGDFTLYWTVYTSYSKNAFTSTKLTADNAALRGYAFVPYGKKACLLTMWSDGKISLIDLHMSVQFGKASNTGELIGILDNISLNHPIKIIPLDDKYVAIYGSDPNEEGAILLIYNTQFKVIQYKQVHKLYSEDARIWKMYNCIIMPVGQNLMVVPFSLQFEQLSALLGSHKVLQSKMDPDITVVTAVEIDSWLNKSDTNKSKEMNSKMSLGSSVDDLLKEGHTEPAIIEQIIPDAIEKANVSYLKQITNFFIDIPEKMVARLLQFVLSCDKRHFPESTENDYVNLPEQLQPRERVDFLDTLLSRSFSERLILPYLRNELSIDAAILLLKYLVYQLTEDGHNFSSLEAEETEKIILNWMSITIDSNYQKFVLSNDKQIQDVLGICQNIVLEYLNVLDELKSIVPVLTRITEEAKGKSYGIGSLENNLYSIEHIEL